jgi:hypothetical protein
MAITHIKNVSSSLTSEHLALSEEEQWRITSSVLV